MKKHLLLSLAVAAMATSASAEDPVVFPNMMVYNISPNGNYFVSDGGLYFFGIYDRLNQEDYIYGADDNTGELFYTRNFGNCVSNNGIVLGDYYEDKLPYIWKDGEWMAISDLGSKATADTYANGITPDGSRICGNIGSYEFSTDATINMQIPCYWDVQPDGTYSDPILLPNPVYDLFGQVAHYVEGLWISADGKLIAGQVDTGLNSWPIVWRQDDKGDWSYEMLVQHLFNPDQIEIPEDPGDAPEKPKATDYMTDDEKAAYEQALADYNAAPWGQKPPYPKDTDYLSEEELASYNTALADWQTVFDEWQEKLYTYQAACEQVLYASPNFEMNNIVLSSDGLHYVTIANTYEYGETTDMWGDIVYEYYPVANIWDINTATGEVVKYPFNVTLVPTSISDDGTIFASTSMYDFYQYNRPVQAYVLKDGEVTDLKDYLSALDPEWGTWMEENLIHETEVIEYDEEGYPDVVTKEMLFSGTPCISADGKTLTTWTLNAWDYYSDDISYTYLFDLSVFSNIESIGTDTDNQNAPVEYFDLQGRRVLEPGHGLYIRRQGTEASKIVL